MYLRNYGLRKTYLDKCLKSPVSDYTLTINVVNGPNTVSLSTTAPLPYSLIIVKVIELETVSLSDMENLKTVC